MERVAFLIEETGERVFAMINPDELTFERQSGVRPRQINNRPLAAARRSDDPLICLGGGTTDIRLNLLFDVGLLARSSPSFSQQPDFRTNLHAPPAEGQPPFNSLSEAMLADSNAAANLSRTGPLEVTDVRELSGPLWRLAENGNLDAPTEGPPVVFFIWGAAWNVPCIALSVAERFDQFSPDGTPLRSWVRIHLRRIRLPERGVARGDGVFTPARKSGRENASTIQPESVVLTDPISSSRPDLICESVYGDLGLLHRLLDFNNIDDFWSLEPGRVLETPPPSVLREVL